MLPALNIATDATLKAIGNATERSAKAVLPQGEGALRAAALVKRGSSYAGSLEIGQTARQFLSIRPSRTGGGDFSATLGIFQQALAAGDHDTALAAFRSTAKLAGSAGQILLTGQLAEKASKTAPRALRGKFLAAGLEAVRHGDTTHMELRQAFKVATLRRRLGDASSGLKALADYHESPAVLRQIAQKAATLGDLATINAAFAKLPAVSSSEVLALYKEFDAVYAVAGYTPKAFTDTNLLTDLRNRLMVAPGSTADAIAAAKYYFAIGMGSAGYGTLATAARNAAGPVEATLVAEEAAKMLDAARGPGLLNKVTYAVKGFFNRFSFSISSDTVLGCYYEALRKADTTLEQLNILVSARKNNLGQHLVDSKGRFFTSKEARYFYGE